MQKPTSKVSIIGGGLSGLCLAWLLNKKQIPACLLEASDRLGGRIHTQSGALGTPLELGATWLSDEHPHLLELIGELGLKTFPQFSGGISLFQTKSFEPPQKFYVPQAERPSCRIAGGTGVLIDALARRLDPSCIRLRKALSSLQQTRDGLVLEFQDGSRHGAEQVVLCMPPRLAFASLRFSPSLPDSLSSVLPLVQTWMAGTLKFSLEYREAFWRKEGYSGMLFSHSGIVMELYDHSNCEENRFGLTGFLNSTAAAYGQDLRRELVLQQLSSLFGEAILQPATYTDQVWNGAYLDSGSTLMLRPHQNNGHPALQQAYLDGRLHFCGTETSVLHPGYMEGAVVAARSVAERL